MSCATFSSSVIRANKSSTRTLTGSAASRYFSVVIEPTRPFVVLKSAPAVRLAKFLILMSTFGTFPGSPELV